MSVALAEPLLPPRAIVPTPKAFALVVPLTVPELIVRFPAKVFAPERINAEVALFSYTPVTFVPMFELIVVAPLPAPMLVTVPAF